MEINPKYAKSSELRAFFTIARKLMQGYVKGRIVGVAPDFYIVEANNKYYKIKREKDLKYGFEIYFKKRGKGVKL